MLETLVPIGTLLTCLGLVGLAWCIYSAAKAKRADLSEEDMQARLQRLLAINAGSVALAGLGLMAVVVGLVLQ